MTNLTTLRRFCAPLLVLLAAACSAPEPGGLSVAHHDDPSETKNEGDAPTAPAAGPIDSEGDDAAPDLTTLPDTATLAQGIEPATFEPEMEAAPQAATAVASSFSLQAFDTPVKSQGSRPWCTAFATVAGTENLIRHTFGVKENLSEIDHFNAYRIYSVFPSVDAAKKTRIVPEEAWPYWGNPVANYRSRAIARVTSSKTLKSRSEVKAALREGKPVVIGLSVTDAWQRSNGRIRAQGPFRGGHALLVVGYDDDASWSGGGYLTIKNSWGTKWGDLGYAHVPYDYCTVSQCYFIELGGVEYDGKTKPIPGDDPGPTPDPAPATTINEASFKVAVEHMATQAASFRLHLDASEEALGHVRKVTYDIHETFGDARYDEVTSAYGGFGMTTWYTTYAHRWKTNGVRVELDDGRVLSLDGALVTW